MKAADIHTFMNRIASWRPFFMHFDNKNILSAVTVSERLSRLSRRPPST